MATVLGSFMSMLSFGQALGARPHEEGGGDFVKSAGSRQPAASLAVGAKDRQRKEEKRRKAEEERLRREEELACGLWYQRLKFLDLFVADMFGTLAASPDAVRRRMAAHKEELLAAILICPAPFDEQVRRVLHRMRPRPRRKGSGGLRHELRQNENEKRPALESRLSHAQNWTQLEERQRKEEKMSLGAVS